MNTATDFTQAIAFATASTNNSTATLIPDSSPQTDIQYTSLSIIGSGPLSVITALLPEIEITPGV